jgi:polysaccharide export outer membrane protein
MTNKKMCAFLAVILLGFSPTAAMCRAAFQSQQSAAAGDYFVRDYNVGPRDLLEIKVFELPEFNQTVRVSEDGTISLPLLGSVRVSGLTKDAVERKISDLLEARFVKNAQVSIFIKEYQSNRVAVIGAVERPGLYELVGRQNLLQMISQAGGFRDNAADALFILRENGNGDASSLEINLDDLIVNGNQLLNIPLQPYDVINVPAVKIVFVYVFGEVKNPGALEVKKSKGITLLQAIAQAGGLTEDASNSGITVKRRSKEGKETQLKVNLKDIIKGKKPDIELREGDVVIIPESIF